MKREEEILNKAIDYSEIEENFLEYDDCGDVCDDKTFVEKAFKEGAEWADETMIERAVNWLVHNMASGEYLGLYDTIIKPDFITKFKKAMKGENP